MAEVAWYWGDKYEDKGFQNIIEEKLFMLAIVARQRYRFRASTTMLDHDNFKLMEWFEYGGGLATIV